jgi:hypothetical protein
MKANPVEPGLVAVERAPDLGENRDSSSFGGDFEGLGGRSLM